MIRNDSSGNGPRQIAKLPQHPCPPHLPAIFAGDFAARVIPGVAGQECLQIDANTAPQLSHVIRGLPPAVKACPSRIYVIDGDAGSRERLLEILQAEGWAVTLFSSAEAFLTAQQMGWKGCVLVETNLPDMSGIELLGMLRARAELPAIMISSHANVKMVVQAMKAGAFDFIEKQSSRAELLDFVSSAMAQSYDRTHSAICRDEALGQIASLTRRQRQIMDLVLAGQINKIIAADLGISQRTVENHRASIMEKTGSKSIPELVRLVITARGEPGSEVGVRMI